MAAYQVKTFADIVAAVREELKIQSTDTTSINRIKRNINVAYLQRLLPLKMWPWLISGVDLSLPAYIDTGTAAVTAASKTVTLSSAPTISVAGYWLGIDGQNARYKIYSHTAGATTLVLEAPYDQETATAAAYKIWQDAVVLPPQAQETISVLCDGLAEPLTNVGFQEMRRLISQDPKREGDPMWYHTLEAADPTPHVAISGLPSSVSRASAGLVRTLTFNATVASYLAVGDRIRVTGAGSNEYNVESIVSYVSTTTIKFTAPTRLVETVTADTGFTVEKLGLTNSEESTRSVLVYPSLSNEARYLHIDYIRRSLPLENDTDEPLIPIKDRNVLVYGALAMSWDRERNESQANKNEALFKEKMALMAGRLEDSTDFPILSPSRKYLATKRRGRRSWD